MHAGPEIISPTLLGSLWETVAHPGLTWPRQVQLRSKIYGIIAGMRQNEPIRVDRMLVAAARPPPECKRAEVALHPQMVVYEALARI